MQVLNYLKKKLLTVLNLDLSLTTPGLFLNTLNLTIQDFNRTWICLFYQLFTGVLLQ